MARLLSKVSVLVLAAGFILGTPLSIAAAPTAKAQAVTQETSAPDPILSNCYAYVRSQIPSLPLASEITSNTTPHVGAVAFFQYGVLPHYAIIIEITELGFWVKDSNFGGPGIRTHFIAWADPHIRGFWET